MDIVHAIEMLSILADGVNPITGEILPDSDSCNQVEVVRALHKVINYLNNAELSPKKNKPENAGKAWSDSEKEELVNEFRSGMNLSEIARKHGRSRGSIEAKLAQTGLIEYSYFTGYIPK